MRSSRHPPSHQLAGASCHKNMNVSGDQHTWSMASSRGLLRPTAVDREDDLLNTDRHVAVKFGEQETELYTC